MLKSGKAVGRKGDEEPKTVKTPAGGSKRGQPQKTTSGKKAKKDDGDFSNYINHQARARGIDISDM